MFVRPPLDQLFSVVTSIIGNTNKVLEPSCLQPHFQSACPCFMSYLKTTSIVLVPFLSKILGKHENYVYLLVLCLRYQLGLVNKPNISYQFENILNLCVEFNKKGISKYGNFNTNCGYRLRVVLLF